MKGISEPCQVFGFLVFFSIVLLLSGVMGERHPGDTREVPAHVSFGEILVNKREAWEFSNLPSMAGSHLSPAPTAGLK